MWSKRAYDLECIGAHLRASLYYNIDYEVGCEPPFTITPVEPAQFG